MQRQIAIVIVICCLAALSAGSARCAEKRRPNIVLIVADDLGYGELGTQGQRQIPTPNLDRLAAGGVRFTSGYVTAPFCAASRAALLTGRYQTRFGFEFNPIGPQNLAPGVGLPLAETTLADRLRDAGYATALVGKWHLGGTAPFHPQRRGFDEFFGFLNEGHYYVGPPWPGVTTWLRRKTLPDGGQGRWTSPDGRIVWSTHLGENEPEYDTNNPILRSSQPVAETANLTDAFTREACDFISRHRQQPFFLYLAYNAVHSPLQGADEYLQKFAHVEDIQRRIFAAMLSQLDDGVGRVLAALRDGGLEENTLVVFISDNGGPTRELTSSNAPLRGGKGTLWEGGIHVPLIISFPGHAAPGRAVNTPVISMDATATALDLAGIPAGKNRLDGISLLPLLTDPSAPPPHETLFWRVGKLNALRHGPWKLIRGQAGSAWQLFDLSTDVAETTDLAAKQPERVKELTPLWDRWNAEQVEPLWK